MGIRRIDESKCDGCRVCVEDCPLDVLRMDHEKEVAFIKYIEDCQSCFLCEHACPKGAIMVTPARERRTPLAW